MERSTLSKGAFYSKIVKGYLNGGNGYNFLQLCLMGEQLKNHVHLFIFGSCLGHWLKNKKKVFY